MISQIYAAAKRHKGELSCTVHIPVVLGSSTEAEQLGVSPSYTTTQDVPCIKSRRSRTKESTDSGERYVATFAILLHTDPALEITATSIIEFLGRKYSILSYDHDLDMTYWKINLRDE